MAKKKTTGMKTTAAALPVAATPGITCTGYKLGIDCTDRNFLDLEATGDSGGPYHLVIERSNDRTELVQKTLNKLADLWPANDFHFQADAKNEITEIL